MSAQALDSFYVELFFKGDHKGAEEFAKKLDGVHTSAMSLAGMIVGATAGIFAFVGSIAHGMAELHDFAETNDLSAAKVDALGKVAAMADVTMDQLKSSVQGLNTMIGEVSKGVPRAVKMFETFGVSAKDASGNIRSVDEMLEVVADKIKSMPNRSEQLAMLGKLRIEPNMVKLLKDGGAALRQMREEAEGKGLLSDLDYDNADSVVKLFMRAGNTAGVLSKLLASKLYPAIKKVLEGYLEFFSAQKDATKNEFMVAFRLMGAGIEVLWGYFKGLVQGIVSAVEWLQKFNVLTYLATGVLAIYAGVMTSSAMSALSKWVLKLADSLVLIISNTTALGLWTGAVRVFKMALNGLLTGALLFIIDSLVNWALGNDSVIGQLVNEFPMALWALIPAIAAIAAGWIALNWATISSISSSIAIVAMYAASAVAGAATIMTAALRIASAWVIANWPLVLGAIAVSALIAVIYVFWDTIKSAAQSIGDLWGKYVLEPFQEGIDLFNQAKALLGGSYDSQVSVNHSNNGMLDRVNAPGGVLGRAEGMSSSSRSNTVNVNGVTMHVTTNDPKVVAQSFSREVREAVRNHQNSVAN